jgi:hypothetical protein
MQALLRRINLDYNGRMTFPEFALMVRPYQIDAYMERIGIYKTRDRKAELDREKLSLFSKFHK